MTLHEISTQLHSLSVGGFFNREKFSRDRLESQLRYAFLDAPAGSRYVIEIALPDGWWYCSIYHYGTGRDQFDYCIPDNREQEAKIKSIIGI